MSGASSVGLVVDVAMADQLIHEVPDVVGDDAAAQQAFGLGAWASVPDQLTTLIGRRVERRRATRRRARDLPAHPAGAPRVGGGACTLLVLGTDRGRVLQLHHGTTEAAADLSGDQAHELAGYLTGAAGQEA